MGQRHGPSRTALILPAGNPRCVGYQGANPTKENYAEKNKGLETKMKWCLRRDEKPTLDDRMEIQKITSKKTFVSTITDRLHKTIQNVTKTYQKDSFDG